MKPVHAKQTMYIDFVRSCSNKVFVIKEVKNTVP